jgi:UDP-glucuronate decarboxylase
MDTDSTLIGPMNLGNPSEYTMKDLAEEIIRLTNSKSEISFLPLPADDPKQRKPDITFASESLSWSPRVNLQDGLQKTIEEFISRLA